MMRREMKECHRRTGGYRYSESSRASLSKFRLGTCVRLRRRLNRTESVRRSSFSELYDYLDTHGYKAKSDAIIFPSFLNLDSKNSDIEVIYVPIAQTTLTCLFAENSRNRNLLGNMPARKYNL